MDRDVRVQVWNETAAELWGLRDDEVEGEHLTDLDIGLPVEQLNQPIRACLNGGPTHASSNSSWMLSAVGADAIRCSTIGQGLVAR